MYCFCYIIDSFMEYSGSFSPINIAKIKLTVYVLGFFIFICVAPNKTRIRLLCLHLGSNDCVLAMQVNNVSSIVCFLVVDTPTLLVHE